uniref:uncharacterized protein LOC120330436 n=1 Tax=Styela clava TaxID=7725 RepID=UPI001939EDDB|nr:uncharacterized protein LOC120330436 [Styela clava]
MSFEINQAEQCKISENVGEIDWDKFPDAWYEVLHTNDPVMGKDVGGVKLRNFTRTRTGVSMMITELHQNSHSQTMTVHLITKRAGVYEPKKSDESAVLTSHTLTPKGGRSEDAAKIDYAMFNGDVLILSDEKNYLINVFCSLSDEWVVWAGFPTMNPTIPQVTMMWNELMEKGINVQLHLAEAVEHPENFMGLES